MSNPILYFQDLVAQVPDIIQPLILAAAGAIPFIEGEGATAIGVIGGVNPVLAALAGIIGNFACVVVVVLLGSRIRAAATARRNARVPVPAGAVEPAPEQPRKPESKGRQKLGRWLVRFGVPGASLLGPLALPTQFTAAALVASGVEKRWVILWQGIAIVLWSTLVAVSGSVALVVLGG
ncbi:small multidrug efflux protein [Microbacteriaceae bacterium VKM Ac-2854]|nr:small multidrug efflux protein [Microbacteriaceae bacterium VKM Ac-2854]